VEDDQIEEMIDAVVQIIEIRKIVMNVEVQIRNSSTKKDEECRTNNESKGVIQKS